MWGMQLVREELGTAARHVRKLRSESRVKGVPTGSWEIGGGNGEMDEGSEGRSGVTVGGQQLCEVRIRGNPRFA
jgi:hypothetical protein